MVQECHCKKQPQLAGVEWNRSFFFSHVTVNLGGHCGDGGIDMVMIPGWRVLPSHGSAIFQGHWETLGSATAICLTVRGEERK